MAVTKEPGSGKGSCTDTDRSGRIAGSHGSRTECWQRKREGQARGPDARVHVFLLRCAACMNSWNSGIVRKYMYMRIAKNSRGGGEEEPRDNSPSGFRHDHNMHVHMRAPSSMHVVRRQRKGGCG